MLASCTEFHLHVLVLTELCCPDTLLSSPIARQTSYLQIVHVMASETSAAAAAWISTIRTAAPALPTYNTAMEVVVSALQTSEFGIALLQLIHRTKSILCGVNFVFHLYSLVHAVFFFYFRAPDCSSSSITSGGGAEGSPPCMPHQWERNTRTLVDSARKVS